MRIEQAQELVRHCLPVYGFDDAAQIQFVKYRENHVFRVDDANGESYAVRLHRPGYRTIGEIATELHYLDALWRAGVPVPQVVADRDGNLMSMLGEGANGRVVSVQRWIDDAVPFGDIEGALSGRHDPSPDAFHDIGALLGQLHSALDDIEQPAAFDRAAWDADGLAGERPVWGDPQALTHLSSRDRDIIRRSMTRLRAALEGADVGPEAFGVIHADATPENVLVTADGLALIDFDDFGTGWSMFDLTTAIFHHARNPRYLEFESAIIEGYTEHRALPAMTSTMWDELMLARGLTYLGWASERPGDPASEFIGSTVAPWVIEIAEAFLSGRPAPWRHPAPLSETS